MKYNKKPSKNGNITINDDNEIYGGPLDGKKIIISKNISKNIVYWGFSQWYKWRWNKTHIDLGIISIYELKRKWIWNIVAVLTKPMRIFYHQFYVYNTIFKKIRIYLFHSKTKEPF